MPRSQRTHKTTKIVQSIDFPISLETRVYSACAAPGEGFRFFQMIHTRRCDAMRLFICAHSPIFLVSRRASNGFRQLRAHGPQSAWVLDLRSEMENK